MADMKSRLVLDDGAAGVKRISDLSSTGEQAISQQRKDAEHYLDVAGGYGIIRQTFRYSAGHLVEEAIDVLPTVKAGVVATEKVARGRDRLRRST